MTIRQREEPNGSSVPPDLAESITVALEYILDDYVQEAWEEFRRIATRHNFAGVMFAATAWGICNGVVVRRLEQRPPSLKYDVFALNTQTGQLVDLDEVPADEAADAWAQRFMLAAINGETDEMYALGDRIRTAAIEGDDDLTIGPFRVLEFVGDNRGMDPSYGTHMMAALKVFLEEQR